MTEPDKIHIMYPESNFSLCGRYFPYYQTEFLNTVDCFCCHKTHEFLKEWEKAYPGYEVRRIPSKVDLNSIEIDPYARDILSSYIDQDFLFEGIIASKHWRPVKPSDKIEDPGVKHLPVLTLQNITIGNTVVADHIHLTAPSYWWYITDIGYRIRFRAIVYKYSNRNKDKKYGLRVYDGDPFYVLTKNATKLKGVGYYAVRSMGR